MAANLLASQSRTAQSLLCLERLETQTAQLQAGTWSWQGSDPGHQVRAEVGWQLPGIWVACMEFLVVPWLGKAAHAQLAGCGWSGPHPRKLDVGSVSQQLPRCVRERERASHFTSLRLGPQIFKREGREIGTACGLFSGSEFSLWDPLSWTSILVLSVFLQRWSSCWMSHH